MKLKIWREGRPGSAAPRTFGDLLAGRRPGAPQAAAGLGMIPLFGAPAEGASHAAPESALSLTQVRTYGTLTLKNGTAAPAVVPMHLGYLQKGAQNHAMCRTWVIEPRAEHTFEDACCIQAAQGGYIKNAEERFIVLPQPLRKKAFELRGKNEFGKLWNDIGRFNASVGLKQRGHLDELKQHRQPDLLRTAHQLEPLEGQTGALFYWGDTLVGLELAPNAAYWAELHRPLVMYCYGPLKLLEPPVRVMSDHRTTSLGPRLETGGLESLDHLAARLAGLAEARQRWAEATVAELGRRALPVKPSGRAAGHALYDLDDGPLVGQAILRRGQPVYASMTA